MPTKKIEKLELLKSDNYYGVVIWQSIFGQRMAKRQNQSLLINRILGLKSHNKHRDFFKLVILAAQKHFKCDSIAIIPGSKPGLTNLQKALNNGVFVRRKKIASRKYQKDKNYDILKGIEASTENLRGRILLVDDVITTGYTMDQYEKLLTPFRLEVVKFGLGINHKLSPEIIDELEIKKDADYLSRAEIGEYFQIPRQRVYSLIQAGRIKEYPGKGIKLAEAITGYEANRSGGEVKAYDRYKDAQADREQSLARMAELDLKQREGELVEIAVIDEAAAATIRITTTKLLALGTKVAPLIVGEKNIGKIKKIIDDQIYETLNELKKLKDLALNENGKH